MEFRQGFIHCVFGDRGSGKSVKARAYARALAGNDKSSLIVYSTPNTKLTDPFYGPDLSSEHLTNLPAAVAVRANPDLAFRFAIAQCKRFRVTLIVDEAHEVWHENFSDDGSGGKIFHRSRHIGLGIIVVSQWPARLDKRVFRAADTVFWGRMQYSRDLKWVEAEFGKYAANQVYNLPKYHFIKVDKDNLPKGWGWDGGRNRGPDIVEDSED